MKRVLGILTAGCLMFTLASPSSADEKGKAKPKADAPAKEAKTEMAGKMDEKAMAETMAKWEKFATPGPQHARFKKMIGKWQTSTQAWMAPGAPPMESKGLAEFTVQMGGRFLIQTYKSEFMGKPFEGMGIEGYDNFKKKYSSYWIDNMGTASMIQTGTCSDDGATCTYFGRMDEPTMDETDKTVKSTIQAKNEDSFLWSMYDFLPGGQEIKIMEINYTRVK